CSATVAKLLARRVEPLLADHPTIDGVVALTHGSGCGMTADGEGMAVLRRTLRGYARHPNFAALVVIGLGCEVNQVADLLDRLYERIRWWEGYTARHGGSVDNNPSPGNKAGGLTTILEKSLGAVAKGGTSPLAGVCEYAEPPPARGLVFMDTPGYDPVSATG